MSREEDDALFSRIRHVLPRRKDIAEKTMFGGRCILVGGNMALGTWRDNLVVRLEKENYEKNLEELHAKPFDVTGRPMKG